MFLPTGFALFVALLITPCVVLRIRRVLSAHPLILLIVVTNFVSAVAVSFDRRPIHEIHGLDTAHWLASVERARSAASWPILHVLVFRVLRRSLQSHFGVEEHAAHCRWNWSFRPTPRKERRRRGGVDKRPVPSWNFRGPPRFRASPAGMLPTEHAAVTGIPSMACTSFACLRACSWSRLKPMPQTPQPHPRVLGCKSAGQAAVRFSLSLAARTE